MKDFFSFFLNPGPSVLLTIIIFIAKISGFDIPWIVVFSPMLGWCITVVIFVLILLWGVRKIWNSLKELITKKQP